MPYVLELENPSCKLSLGDLSFEIINRLRGFPYKSVIENQYLVLSKVTSLGGIKHDLGLHFSNQQLTKLELFFFDLDHIDTEDEFNYIQVQLVKIYGKPTASAIQDGKFQQNQWIFENRFEITNNQTAERGHSLMFKMYDGSTLTSDGRWKPR